MSEVEPIETTDTTETPAPEQGTPDCPLYGQYHDTEPDQAAKASIRVGALWGIIGGLIGVVGGMGGKLFWLGRVRESLAGLTPGTEEYAKVAAEWSAAWMPYVVAPLTLGAVLCGFAVWLPTVKGSAPDRGGMSARVLSRIGLLAIPYAIYATYASNYSDLGTTANQWLYLTGVLLALSLLALMVARHLDNILAAVGADGRLMAQLFYFAILVAAAFGLQQDPAEPRVSGFFLTGLGVAVFFGVLTLVKVRSEMIGVHQDSLEE